MKIAHIVADHVPFDVRVFHKECRSLAAAGHEVHLVAADASEEQRDGVHFRSSGPRAARPAWPAPFRQGRMLCAHLMCLGRTYRAARAVRADAYHVHEPMLIIVGLLLRRHGVRVVYDAHEEYRQVARRVQLLQPLRGRLLWVWYALLESTASRMFDLIVAATPAISRQFPRVEVVHNYPLTSELVGAGATSYGERPPRAIFAGGISQIRGSHELVNAMELLPRESEARLDLVGKFMTAGLEPALRRLPGWRRVDFHGWRSREEMRELLDRTRVGVVTFHPVPNHTEALPNKLFEYMAAGIPVVASNFPLWRSIVEGAGCGLLVDPLDSAAIAAAIGWLLDHPGEAEAMGRRGEAAVRERYNWDLESAKLVSLYERELQPPGRAV